jgi:hypothetical protein
MCIAVESAYVLAKLLDGLKVLQGAGGCVEQLLLPTYIDIWISSPGAAGGAAAAIRGWTAASDGSIYCMYSNRLLMKGRFPEMSGIDALCIGLLASLNHSARHAREQ